MEPDGSDNGGCRCKNLRLKSEYKFSNDEIKTETRIYECTECRKTYPIEQTKRYRIPYL